MKTAPPDTHTSRPTVRSTFNLAAMIPTVGRDLNALHADAIHIVLSWLKASGKSPQHFPDTATSGQSFHVEAPGQSVDCVSIPEQGLWTVRLVHPDMPFNGRPAVAGRTWSIDVGLRRTQDGISVGVKSVCSSLGYAAQDIALTRPRVVIDLASRLGLAERLPIRPEAWTLKSEQDLDQLARLLFDKQRVLPIVVVSASTIRRLGAKSSTYLVDANALAKKLQGYAHVVALPHHLSFSLTSRLTKTWSVFLGSLRTYMPRLDPNVDQPFSHPLLLGDKLLAFQHRGLEGEPAIVEFLREKVAAYSATRRPEWGERLFLDDAKTLAAEVARKAAADDQDWKALLEAEIESWKAKAAEAQKLAEGNLEMALQIDQERDYYKNENAALRAKIDSLQASLNARVGNAGVEPVAIPAAYEDMPDWVRQNLAGSLILHSRAVRALKDAKYSDVGLVYNALLLLAREYRDMKRGIVEREVFDSALRRLGLKIEKSISKSRAGEEGDTYYVRYPTLADPSQFLEWHLTKGADREARNCLRIYFFWDDATQQVVVGWLPSHLSTRIT